jgi:hypothetical protein
VDGRPPRIRYCLRWTERARAKAIYTLAPAGIPGPYLEHDGGEEYDHDRGADWSSPRKLPHGRHAAETDLLQLSVSSRLDQLVKILSCLQ